MQSVFLAKQWKRCFANKQYDTTIWLTALFSVQPVTVWSATCHIVSEMTCLNGLHSQYVKKFSYGCALFQWLIDSSLSWMNTFFSNITKYLFEGDYIILLVSVESPIISVFQELQSQEKQPWLWFDDNTFVTLWNWLWNVPWASKVRHLVHLLKFCA